MSRQNHQKGSAAHQQPNPTATGLSVWIHMGYQGATFHHMCLLIRLSIILCFSYLGGPRVRCSIIAVHKEYVLITLSQGIVIVLPSCPSRLR